ncbi:MULTISPECIES: hypothetical protein [Sphingomonas]|uniref:hypothetical protein n=1 Tax=Sphingomonas TaxID=13687 RepID=UPI000DEF1330|nr:MULTISPECIES: hypothetical protein [Sphingomonas]
MMSSTCQQIAILALEKIGVLGAGATPETVDTDRALGSLRSYYQRLINGGAFGRCDDVIPNSSPYYAGEFERVVHDGTVTVILPQTLPYVGADESYGEVCFDVDFGRARPPVDLCLFSEVSTAVSGGYVRDYIWDGRVRKWCEINGLQLTDYAPLSARDEDGLACAIAIRLAATYGQQPTPETTQSAMRFEEALVFQWSENAEFVERGSFW